MNKFLALLILIYSNLSYSYWLGAEFRYGESAPSFKLSNEENSLTFNPNPINDFTLSMIGPNYSIGIQFVAEKEDDGEFLDSNYSDSKISFYTETYLASLSYTSFEDFYVLSDRDNLNDNKTDDTLSGTKLSLSTLFFLDGSKLHELHGESVLKPVNGYGYYLNLTFEHGEIRAGNNLVPASYENEFPELTGVESLSYDSIDTELGISGLYAWESFYINSFIQVGPTLSSQTIDGDEKITKSMVSPLGETMVGFAYYDSNLQIGVRGKMRIKRNQINGAYIDEEDQVAYGFLTYLF